MKKLLALLLFSFSLSAFAQNEATLFDETGTPTHYIEYSSGIVYSFSGEPVAFLKSKSGYSNIYNYKGKHIGWFENGLVRDHKGDIVGFQSGAVTNVFTKFEPFKGFKKTEPFRPFEEFEPFKPFYSSKFSTTPLSYYFISTSTNSTTNSYNNQQTYIPQGQTFTPDFGLIQEAMNRLQARHDALIRNGYIYDEETETYIHESQFEGIKQERIKQIGIGVKMLSDSKYFREDKKVEDGKHLAFYFNIYRQFPVLYTSYVIVKKNKIKRVIVGNKKWRAFEGGTISKGMVISRFKSSSDLSNLYKIQTKYPNHFFMVIN